MNGLATASVIDCHAHVRIEVDMGPAWTHGPEYGTDSDGKPWYRIGNYQLRGVRHTSSPFTDIELRLKFMDAAGIDFQVLSPSPLTYFHFIQPEQAAAYCKQWNDALAAIVIKNADRVTGLATLPMQDPVAAIMELERAVTQLGLAGAAIGTDFGRSLDSAELDPLYAKACELDVPIFIHGGPAGIDGPPGDPNLKRFDLDVVCGFAAQGTIAVATLIYGGVLRRHPTLRICISDGGGATPFLAGRMKQAGMKRPWAEEWLKEEGAFETQLARLWFDTNVGDPRSLAFLMQIMGTDHLVMGTNFAGWDQQTSVKKGAEIAGLADNARRLLGHHPKVALPGARAPGNVGKLAG